MKLRVGDRIDPEWLGAQRWFGSRGRPVVEAAVEERFGLPWGGGLGVVRVDSGRARPEWYSMPLEPDGPTWRALAALASSGGSVAGEAGWSLVGVAPPGPGVGAGRRSVVRAADMDQSNTSVILDGELILKLYRRLEPGRNAEAELSTALARLPGAPVPAFFGSLRLLPPALPGARAGQRRRPADVAVLQRYVEGAADEFERFADSLAEWLQDGASEAGRATGLADLASAGQATALLHAALGRLRGRGLAPRLSTPADSARWRARAARALPAAQRAMAALDPGLASRLRAAAPAIRTALAPLAEAAPGLRLTRIHGDLHVGQLIRDGERFLLADLEGEPTRPQRDRRRPDLPLRDVASMLRSIDHVARSARRRAGTSGPPGALDLWIDAARRAFLGGYDRPASGDGSGGAVRGDGTGSGTDGGDRGGTDGGDRGGTDGRDPSGNDRLLHALEVEKELYEFSYAAAYLPHWRYAPAAGLRWLLDRTPS